MERPTWSALGLMALVALGVGSVAGCGATKVSGTTRTATEQLLLSTAWDDALRRVDFRPLTGVPVYFDSQYLTSTIDQGWMVSSIRQAMLAQGVLLRPKAEQAQWIVEARVGTYGTNDSNWMIGIPQTQVPAVPGYTAAATVPEVALAKKNRQQGVAKLALYAYDRATGQVTWTSGTQASTSSSKDVYIGGLGPIRSGSIHSHPEFFDMHLPSVSDSKVRQASPLTQPEPPQKSPPSPQALPLDQSSFAP